MEKAVSRLNTLNNTNSASVSDLGGDFAISDLVTNENGSLKICMEGIGLTFEDKKVINNKI